MTNNPSEFSDQVKAPDSEYDLHHPEQIDTNPENHNHPIPFNDYQRYTEITLSFSEALTLSNKIKAEVKSHIFRKDLQLQDLIAALDGEHEVVTEKFNPYTGQDFRLAEEIQKIENWKEIEITKAKDAKISKIEKEKRLKKIRDEADELAEEKEHKLEDLYTDTGISVVTSPDQLDHNRARKTFNRFINKLTWFQESPFLPWIDSKGDNVNKRIDQRKVSLSILPVFLFILADPNTINTIVELGRNDFRQRAITQPLSYQSIKKLHRSFTDGTGSSGTMDSSILIDVISNFVKPIIQAIYNTKGISFINNDTTVIDPKNLPDNKDIPNSNGVDLYAGDSLFWLQIRNIDNIVNIGKFARVPIFDLDDDFKEWYQKNLISKSKYDEQYVLLDFIRTKEDRGLDIPKVADKNLYFNWQTEEYMRRKGLLKGLV